MSYCRWSSDDYTCDAYVWADCDGGWRTEIASRRRVWHIKLPPRVTLPVGAAHSPERSAWAEAWASRSSVMAALVDNESNWSWLDLSEPEGGRSYWHDTPSETADNLERLRNLGVTVPQGAIDALREEATTPTEARTT